MICKKCNSTIRDGIVFCPYCGEKVSNGQPSNNNNSTRPTGTQSSNTQRTPNQPSFNQPFTTSQPFNTAPSGSTPKDFNMYTPNFDEKKSPSLKKSGRGKLFGKIALIAAPIIAVVLVIALNFNLIAGFFVKTFGSEKDYMKFAEENAFGEIADGVTSYYGSIKESVSDNSYSELKMSVNLSKDALKLVEDFSGIDVEFLNKTEITLGSGRKDTKQLINLLLEINGKKIADPSVIIDSDKGELYLSIAELGKKSLFVDMGDSDETPVGGSSMLSTMVMGTSVSSLNPIIEALPSEKELGKLLDKYIGIVADNLDEDNITESSDTIKVDSIKEKITKIEYVIETDNVNDILIAVLEEASEDKDLEKYINNVADALEDADIISVGDDVYDVFIDSIDMFLEQLEEDDSENETICVLVDYINSKHEIVGRKIIMGDGEDEEESTLLYYATAHDGNKFATEANMYLFGDVTFTGSGTDKGGAITGKFDLKMNDHSILRLETEKFETDIVSKGKLKGTVRIYPSEDLLDNLNIPFIDGLSISDAGIELILDTKGNEGSVTVNLIMGDEVFVGFTLESKSSSTPKIKTPSDKDTIELEDEDAMIDFVDSLDTDKLINNLEKANIPDDITDLIEEVINSVK